MRLLEQLELSSPSLPGGQEIEMPLEMYSSPLIWLNPFHIPGKWGTGSSSLTTRTTVTGSELNHLANT
ncbi:hypothetical protein DSO57_1008384 [Entomophthora muscae]|uniref:Uncharacterized protein n=1 Tax=Entomophthora muscae TaxID=34485 RepID=A0ACC2RY88_9FUNG|nr:hypothetical protein DSO57_1008384 [Entomophthora muscae]